MAKPEAVFFDVGGTLLSSDMQLFNNLAKELNSPNSVTELKRMFSEKKSAITNNFKTIVQIIAEILIEKGYLQDRAVGFARELYAKSFITSGTIYPETMQILEELRTAGLKLGVISDADWDILKLQLEKFKLLGFFSSFSVSSEVMAYKPSKKIFEHALTNSGLPAEKIIYVGDTQDDIEGSNSTGMLSVFINRDSRNSSKLKIDPDFEISTLLDLSELLKYL